MAEAGDRPREAKASVDRGSPVKDTTVAEGRDCGLAGP